MRNVIGSLLSTVLIVTSWPTLEAYAQAEPSAVVLFHNARVFDGKSATLTAPTSVLIEGTKIARIGAAITAPADAR